MNNGEPRYSVAKQEKCQEVRWRTNLPRYLNALSAKLDAQTAQLNQAIAQRNQALVGQQHQDQTAPLPDVLAGWPILVPTITVKDVQPAPEGVTVTEKGARETIATLEQVPVSTKNLADVETLSKERLDLINNQKDLIDKNVDEVAGLKNEIQAQGIACKTQVDEVTTAGKKTAMARLKQGFAAGMAVMLVFVKLI